MNSTFGASCEDLTRLSGLAKDQNNGKCCVSTYLGQQIKQPLVTSSGFVNRIVCGVHQSFVGFVTSLKDGSVIYLCKFELAIRH